MHLESKNQINNSEYYQLRFSFNYHGEVYECFATAPKLLPTPSKLFISIHCLGLSGDVMISPEDVEDDVLEVFVEAALEHWVYETSLP